MAKKNENKKDNPLLVGILMTVVGIILCFAGNSKDLMLFGALRLDGAIAFPIFGGVCILIGICKIVEFIKSKKK